MASEYYHIFVGCGTEALGLFESQVLGLLSSLRKSGVEPLLLLFRNASSDMGRLRNSLESYGLSDRTLIFPHDIFRLFFAEKTAKLVQERVMTSAPGKRILFHCRGEAATLMGIRLRGLLESPGQPSPTVLFDNRGIRKEEVRSHFGIRPYHEAKLLVHGAARFVASRKCDAYSFVTTAMREYYMTSGYDRAKPSLIVPTCVDPAEFPWVEEKSFDLAYSGSSWAWQNLDAVFSLLGRLLEVDPALRMLVLVDDPAKAARAAAGIPSDSLTITRIPGSEVPEMLSRCRAGLVLRDDSLINRVASPVKIGEYLSAGMKVVYTGRIGSVNDLLDLHPEACSRFVDAGALSAGEIVRKISEPCETKTPDYFDWASHLGKYASLMARVGHRTNDREFG